MNAINIEHDEKAIEAVQTVSAYCKEHPNCKNCFFSFSQVCILKWARPAEWDHALSKVLERRKEYGRNR
jgi:hypothetical protein